jgi:transposase
MDVLFERCCGLDIHKRTVVAYLVMPGSNGQPVKDVRSFGTMTDELIQLADWLATNGVTHVALESTGSIGSRCETCWKGSSNCS